MIQEIKGQVAELLDKDNSGHGIDQWDQNIQNMDLYIQ